MSIAISPSDFAETQANIGSDLFSMAKRTSDTVRLREAIDALSAALPGVPRDEAPVDWANISNLRGQMLLRLGSMTRSIEPLIEARDIADASLATISQDFAAEVRSSAYALRESAVTSLSEFGFR